MTIIAEVPACESSKPVAMASREVEDKNDALLETETDTWLPEAGTRYTRRSDGFVPNPVPMMLKVEECAGRLASVPTVGAVTEFTMVPMFTDPES